MDFVIVRLKIEVDADFFGVDSRRFWYSLDTTRIKTIKDLKADLLLKIAKLQNEENMNIDNCNVDISLDGFELPVFETAGIVREGDILRIGIKKQVQKRKLNMLDECWDDDLVPAAASVYDACLIGTSMIKNIDCGKLLPSKKCFFQSLSGGLIQNVHDALKTREDFLSGCKMFIITCGSNDCDSTRDIKTVITDILHLAQYLSQAHPDSKLIFNKLIPRLKTRYTQLDEFEKKRVCFNNFLESTLTILVKHCFVVTHEKFESKTELDSLLIDGVHISPIRGLPIYTQQIQMIINNSLLN